MITLMIIGVLAGLCLFGMAAVYNDGTVQYGSQVMIALDAVGGATYGTYVADNISVNRPTKEIDRTNQLGEPTGSVGIAGFVTGSATWQFAASTTKEPLNGKYITQTFDSTIGAENFVITSVGLALQKDGEKKANVTFKKVYN